MTSPFSDGIQYAWDSTSIKLAETCLYKYGLKMGLVGSTEPTILGWQPDRKSAHLIFGGIYASALEDYHKAVAQGIDREQAIRDVVHMALIETWEYDQCERCDGTGEISTGPKKVECPDCGGQGILEGSGHPWDSNHNLKTRGNLIRSIVWYFEQFRDDPCTTVILSTGAAAVEHSFKLPVDNGIVLAGHLDRLVEYSNHLYVQDQKTSGSTITGRFFESFNPDTQMSLYTWAGKAIFHIPVKGVMIDAAQIAVGFTRFERGFTFRSDDQLEEWYDGAMNTIERARQATRDGYFPMNPSSCGNFGGCEFRNVCNKAPSVRQQFLKGDFALQPIWNPLRSR
jgi:hypothetical protein